MKKILAVLLAAVMVIGILPVAVFATATDAAVIIVTHSMEDAARLADRILVLNHGKLVLNGTADQIFQSADDLIAMGLNVPVATRLINDLRKLGCDLSPAVYTPEKAVAEIEAFLRRRNR